MDKICPKERNFFFSRKIRRTIFVNGCVGASQAKAIEKAKRFPPKFTFDLRTRGLLGAPEIVCLRLKQLGVQEIIVTLPDVVDREPLHLLAQCLN